MPNKILGGVIGVIVVLAIGVIFGPAFGQEMKDVLAGKANEIITAMQTAAPQATAAYLEYVWVSAMVGAVWAGLGSLVLASFIVLCIRAIAKNDYDNDGYFIIAAVCFLLLVISSSLLGDYVVRMMAPEGAAIADIIRAID